ncbi:non-heme iron oxygenase ferredoxin subunit [Spirochaeta thermophila]|uniref:Rieske domain-containing protein n=1 Tax=Winmispira thermophila (strain ATCC 49972 / DSM 6192 / RI 19.B1) TaxID=665571 RepID=E0RQN5_WINT6|nr:non-heme iron oxygenase ferredoxin subunit [Spirochaeta thermophila]ADN01539.1 hypothetical protein STHERM_c05740 [Spirochaeta thermophila DSM 6192]
MAKWHRTVPVDSFQRAASVQCGKRRIALFKLEDGVYAIDDVCSHEFSLLSEGEVWEGEVYCVKHGSRFDIRTGKVLSLPATKDVRTYEVKVEDGYVYVRC